MRSTSDLAQTLPPPKPPPPSHAMKTPLSGKASRTEGKASVFVFLVHRNVKSDKDIRRDEVVSAIRADGFILF